MRLLGAPGGVAVSPGEHVWGVDPALSRLAFAFAAVESGDVQVETLITRTEERDGARPGLLDRQVRIYARQAAGRYPPACVWVEQPSGRFRNLPLAYCVGTLCAALYEALAVPVWTIPSGAWKRRTVGVGNASKLQIRAWVDALPGVSVDGQNEADAVAIAVAGRAMFRAGSWEAAA
jgi:Holliday junction resolvasome RuvABC endonuclease subunit